jgi:hypothetical protein
MIVFAADEQVKYGALSVDTGILDLSGVSDDYGVTLSWTERGRPTVRPPSEANIMKHAR